MRVRKAVLPVAGLGTRFLPATKAMPKEMLPVVDKPLIQYAVEEAWATGIEEVIFVTGRGKGALEDHFDRSLDLEMFLRNRGKHQQADQLKNLAPESGTIYYTRQNEPLGLGHAIWTARNMVGDEPFAVLLADDLIQSPVPVLEQMVKQFERLQSSMVAVMEVPPHDVSKYGILKMGKMEGDVVEVNGLVEKPQPEHAPSNLAIIGRYILTPRIFDHLAKQNRGEGGEIQLTDAMAGLLHKERIYGLRFHGTRYDCGDKAGFQMANLALALERHNLRARLLPFLDGQSKKWHNIE